MTLKLDVLARKVDIVTRFEVILNDHDPYFNYQATKYLSQEGISGFRDWSASFDHCGRGSTSIHDFAVNCRFDEKSWYPLGRVIGGTIHPGLMGTSVVIYNFLSFFNPAIQLQAVCIFLAPFFASNTTIVTYFFAKQVMFSQFIPYRRV
jgi:dolichyl-diphosphooligosaccharide--protein glycosyltransferase